MSCGINHMCQKCGSVMFTSQERNFNGPKCKNKKCDGEILEAIYEPFESTKPSKIEIKYDDNGKIILTAIFTKL